MIKEEEEEEEIVEAGVENGIVETLTAKLMVLLRGPQEEVVEAMRRSGDRCFSLTKVLVLFPKS